MSLSTWIPWIACAGVGAVALVSAAQTRELARRLEVLEATPAAPLARPGAAPGDAAGTGPTLLVGGGPATQVELQALRRTVAALEQRVGAASPPAGATSAGAGSAAFEQGVRDVLARVSEEPDFKQKVAAAAAPTTLPKKPTFAALADYLTLDGNQEDDFRRDLEDVQGSLFALLSERRPDGRVLLEEIGQVEALPEGDPKRGQVFLDMISLKIPGTEETYLARALKLSVDFRKRVDGYLRPEQRARFAGLDVDLFGVKMN